MALIALTCPGCGGELEFDDSREFMFCQFCGKKLTLQQEQKVVNITQNINQSIVSDQSILPLTSEGYYDGPLQDGRPHGKGIFIWRSGVKYEGDFSRGIIEGHGKKTYPGKGYYEGDFADNMANGFGKCI